MIVTYAEDGWEIVLQRSHGLLAAQICAQWNKADQPGRWVETLIATAEHDDGTDELLEPEVNPETGGPKNFKMKDFEAGLCDKLLNKAFAKGRYVGLLIARHIRFLYGKERAAEAYCKNLEKQETQWLKEAGTTKAEIAASYELLEFCDAFSLIICQGVMQPEQRKMDISCGPDGKVYQLVTLENEALSVLPWPFENPEVNLYFETRTISQLAFKNGDEFREKLGEAPVRQRVIVLRKDFQTKN